MPPIDIFNGSFTMFSGLFEVGSSLVLPTTQTFTTTGINNFTVPAGVTSIYCILVGGGGGGAGSENGRNQGYGGGAGGALAYGTIPTTPGENLIMFVGTGGNGGPASGGNGVAGGTTYVSSSAGILIQAGGGAGGQERSTAAAAGGVSSGTFRVGGGNGGNGGGATDNNQGGGGGGAGGYSGNGGAGGGTGAGSNGAGGGGGGGGSTNSGQGYGGGGVGIPAEGSAGTGGAQNAIGTGGSGGANGTRPNGGLYGGGGGACDDDTAGAGGTGAQGVIYISYTPSSGAPSIVTTNLTHQFDAGSVSSYPGSGTVWTNLSGPNNLSLVNTPTFVSNGAASRFIFDGIDDFATGSGYLTGSIAKSHTLNLIGSFASLPTTFTRYRFFTDAANPTSYGMVQEGTTLGPGEVRISQGTPNFNATVYNAPGTSQFISQSQIAMFTFVSSNTGIDFYINGSLVGGTTTDTFVDSSFINPTRVYTWASEANGTSPVSMSIAHIMWYSASLSASDILQNYNALKSRYGI